MLRLLTVVIFLVLLVTGGCWAQHYSYLDTMSVDTVSGYPGDTIAVMFDLTNVFMVGGFEMRVTYNDTSFTPIDLHMTSRTQAFNLFGSNMTDTGVVSLYATSWDPIQNSLPPGRGAVAYLRFLIFPQAQPGQYFVRFVDSDTMSHENSLSNPGGDSLIIPILVDRQVVVLPGSSAGDELPAPVAFNLAQNYPNPFNGTTRISFTLDKAQEINLTIFDLLGHSVATVYSGWAAAGENTAYWDSDAAGAKVASGVYFYRLKSSNDGVLTKMMTLLK